MVFDVNINRMHGKINWIKIFNKQGIEKYRVDVTITNWQTVGTKCGLRITYQKCLNNRLCYVNQLQPLGFECVQYRVSGT